MFEQAVPGKDDVFVLNQEDEIQKALLVTHGGQVLLKRG